MTDRPTLPPTTISTSTWSQTVWNSSIFTVNISSKYPARNQWVRLGCCKRTAGSIMTIIPMVNVSISLYQNNNCSRDKHGVLHNYNIIYLHRAHTATTSLLLLTCWALIHFMQISGKMLIHWHTPSVTVTSICLCWRKESTLYFTWVSIMVSLSTT